MKVIGETKRGGLVYAPGGEVMERSVDSVLQMTDDWFVTASGRRMFLRNPDPKQIHIDDIAHALSHVCRFGGQCEPFYSVAQHCVFVSRHVPPEMALQALMHDATEAYLGDVIRPLKRLLPEYQALEHLWWAAICETFGLSVELPREIKVADLVALATERRDLLEVAYRRRGEWKWVEDELSVQADPLPLVPLPPKHARSEFLKRWDFLTKPKWPGSSDG